MAIGEYDLLIVGAGALGRLVAREWRVRHPSARIVAETVSTSTHEALRAEHITPRTREQGLKDATTFPYIVFCAPPSDEYAADAARCTSRLSENGHIVFTSSTSVFANNDIVTEESELSSSPRAARILAAEREILSRDGTVLRLAGLYSAERNSVVPGILRGTSPSSPEAVINLVHYEDAARAVILALTDARDRVRKKSLLVCDGSPMTVAQIYEHFLRLPHCAGRAMPRFEGLMPMLRKRCYNSDTRKLLNWMPLYPSVAKWVDACLAQMPVAEAGEARIKT